MVRQIPPTNFNYTYDQATMRAAQQDIKTPAEQAAIQAAIQAGRQPTLTDPSQFAQAQVGAAVRQPTLPEGGAVLPNLALQSVTPNQLQTTPGLQGTVAAATPTATVAPILQTCLLYTSPSPRDGLLSRMPSSA